MKNDYKIYYVLKDLGSRLIAWLAWFPLCKSFSIVQQLHIRDNKTGPKVIELWWLKEPFDQSTLKIIFTLVKYLLILASLWETLTSIIHTTVTLFWHF